MLSDTILINTLVNPVHLVHLHQSPSHPRQLYLWLRRSSGQCLTPEHAWLEQCVRWLLWTRGHLPAGSAMVNRQQRDPVDECFPKTTKILTESSKISTCPSLYHCSAGVGKAWAAHSRVSVLLTFTLTSLGVSPSPGISFLLIWGGTEVKKRVLVI